MTQTLHDLVGRIEVDRMLGVELFNKMGERHGSKVFIEVRSPKIFKSFSNKSNAGADRKPRSTSNGEH